VIPVTFYLNDKPGFELTPGYLSFGNIVPNQSATRTVELENLYNEEVVITITVSKSIADNIIVSENDFRLEPGELKVLTFTAFTDGLEEYKKYEGDVTIITRRSFF
jgi:hypothetical protein